MKAETSQRLGLGPVEYLDSGVGCPAAPVGCKNVNGNAAAFNFPRSMQNTPIAGNLRWAASKQRLPRPADVWA